MTNEVERYGSMSDLLRNLADAHADAERLAAEGELDTTGMSPEQRRDAINAKRVELDDAQDMLRAAAKSVEEAMQGQLATMRSALAPLQAQVSKMMSAVEAINLYLGSDETIILLREGEPAPADTPIVVYQTVLFMDEEMALRAEELGIADATIDPGQKGWATFDDWLLDNDAHVRQVCPSPRGVIAFRSARRNRDDRGSRDGSEVTHFLFVNGEQLSWVQSSDDFTVGDRLVPTNDEFDSVFLSDYDRDEHGQRLPLRTGTRQWDQAMATADALRKRYLKIALILQGIVDRSTLLSPLPSDHVSFTDPASYDAGWVQVATYDNALPTGVIPYREWRREICGDIEAGQRVVLGYINHSVLYGEDRYSRGVLSPRTVGSYPRGVPLVVKRTGYRFSVSFRRTDEVWRRDVPVPDKPGYVYRDLHPVPATGYASIHLADRSEGERHLPSWAMPLDHPLVSLAAVDWYLTSREDRHEFRVMIPLLRETRRILVGEAAEEAPFRALLAAEAARRHDLDVDDAGAVVDAAVEWWKSKCRDYRPLVGGDENAAWAGVLDEVGRRMILRSLVDDPATLDRIKAACPDAMWVGRRHDGCYVAVTPADDRDVYVHVHTWTAKRGNPKPPVEWVTAPDVRAWKTIRQTERHRRWPRFVSIVGELTGPETDQLIDLVRAKYPDTFIMSWLKYWGDTAARIVVYQPGEPGSFDEDAPLTGDAQDATVSKIEVKWYRDSDGCVAIKERDGDGSLVDVTHRRDWVDDKRLWADVERLNEIEAAAKAVTEEHERRAGPLRKLVDAAWDAVSDAWEEREVDEEYRRFVEKFGAESTGRWETRRKAVEQKFRFPRHDHDEVRSLFEVAAELGLLWWAETYEIGQFVDMMARFVTEPADVAERLRSLTFTVPDPPDNTERRTYDFSGSFTMRDVRFRRI